MRLWECEQLPFSLANFNNGDYFEAQLLLIDAGNITGFYTRMITTRRVKRVMRKRRPPLCSVCT
ncbi:glycogen/starch/alpha-glucan phosphorylase [Vibrio chagasii]|nr:glycogen/starch/alpha-glucan phosphorylase [Vibrio chagasii]